jgi:hypothetical protein
MDKLFRIGILTCSIYAGLINSYFADAHDHDEDYYTPAAIAERRGQKIEDNIRKHGTDKEQWKAFSLYSDATDPGDLKLILIRNAKFTMRLDPGKELLYFEKPGMKQVFKAKTVMEYNKCQNYSINVFDASATHVAYKLNCYSADPTPGMMKWSSDYILYDTKTASMTDFKHFDTTENKVPLSFVKPDPVVKKIRDGYRIDWVYRNITSNPVETMIFHNTYRYTYDDKLKKWELYCTDLLNLHQEIGEGDACDSGMFLNEWSAIAK